MLRRPLIALLLSSTLLAGFAQAQPQEPPPPPRLTGSTLTGQPFALDALRGKVVLLYFWQTQCVPCLQKMGELRDNAAGWRNKPFALVLINTDRNRADALAYLQTLRDTDRQRMLPMALWTGDLAYGGGLAAPTTAPVAVVIDSQGRVAARHVGRISDDAWDDIAALLP